MVNRSQHGTLAAGVVTTVTFAAEVGGVEVRHRGGGAAPLWVTFDGADPVAGAQDTFFVGVGESYVYARAVTVVRLVSVGAADYSVQELP